MQFIFFFCDLNSWWSPKFSEGVLFERIMNSQFFTETFAPYKTSQFNLYTAFFTIALLPYALIGAIKDLTSRENTKI